MLTLQSYSSVSAKFTSKLETVIIITAMTCTQVLNKTKTQPKTQSKAQINEPIMQTKCKSKKSEIKKGKTLRSSRDDTKSISSPNLILRLRLSPGQQTSKFLMCSMKLAN